MTMDTAKLTEAELTECFEYLDELRDSGATNMYGAAPYLVRAFDMDRDESYKVLAAWMQTFDPELTPAERAGKVEGR